MGYVKASDDASYPVETIAAMAGLLGLAIPPDDLPELATAVRNQLNSIRSIEELDLNDEMPAVEFDPHWRSRDDLPG